jgi:GNAT superfamily N-acetyltransferase
MDVAVRAVEAEDRAAWDTLFLDYATFYEVDQTAAMRDRVWGWLMDPSHPLDGLVAQAGGRLVGIAHFRPFDRPLSASTGGFLDDLFVAPHARGSGAAQALIAAVESHGRAQGWTVIRWITADSNARARAVYDRVAKKMHWVTYDIRL